MTKPDASRARALDLDGKQQFIAGLAGSVSMTFGVLSVFVTDNQAGSVALLVIGSLAWLIALTGRVPDRMGRDGVGYDQLAEQVVKEILTAPDIPDETREAVAESYQQQAMQPGRSQSEEQTHQDLSRYASSILFHRAVLRELRRHAPARTVLRGTRRGTLGPDLLVVPDHQEEAPDLPRLDIYMADVADMDTIVRVRRRLRSASGERGVIAILITNDVPPISDVSVVHVNDRYYDVGLQQPETEEASKAIRETLRSAWMEALDDLSPDD